MLTESVFALKRDDPTFSLFFGLIVVCIVILVVLWDRRYRREWQQFHTKNWPKVEGIFVSGEGEVVTMRKGSSKTIAGYEARLYYEYQYEGEQNGIYTRFFFAKREAEAFLELLEGQKIPVSYN